MGVPMADEKGRGQEKSGGERRQEKAVHTFGARKVHEFNKLADRRPARARTLGRHHLPAI